MKKSKMSFNIWIVNWLELICTIISLLTLTLYRPNWDFAYMCYYTKKELLKKIENERKSNEEN